MLAKTPDAERLCWAHLSAIKDIQPWVVLVMGFLVPVSLCVMLTTLIFEHLNTVFSLQYL